MPNSEYRADQNKKWKQIGRGVLTIAERLGRKIERKHIGNSSCLNEAESWWDQNRNKFHDR